MSNFKSCTPAKAGTNIITCEVVLAYPNLFKPSAPKGEGADKATYNVTALVPKGSDLALLLERVNEVGTEKHGKNVKFKKPFIKTEDQNGKIADFAEEFPTMLRVSSKSRPAVVYANGKDCDDEEQVYSGRKARISVNVYGWNHPTGGKGVSLGLGNVMLLDHGDVLPLGGGRVAAEEEFDFADVGEAATADDLYS